MGLKCAVNSPFSFGVPTCKHLREDTGELMPKLFLAAVGAAFLAAAPAFASQDCAADLGALSARREAAMKGINDLVAAAHGKKLDPDAFCGRSRPLAAAEDAMIAYMQKNKDWCQLPDEAIAGLKATHAKRSEE